MDYSIGQFAAITQMSIDTLRFYEKEQLITVKRDPSGRRRYTEEDYQWMLFIRRLKETGMPVKNIRHYALLRHQGDSTMEERLQMLEHHRTFIIAEKERWEKNLRHLDEKIKIYKKRITDTQKTAL